MKKKYHLTFIAHLIYSFMMTVILSGIYSFGVLLMDIEVSDNSSLLVFLSCIVISVVYFYFHVIIIEDEKITFSQKFNLHRKIVNYSDFTKLMFRYYYPLLKSKKNTNYGQRGYKFNVNGPKDFVKILSHQYSYKTKNAMFDAIISKNPEIYINKQLQKEIEFIKSKLEKSNPYLRDSFDELIELGFRKDYYTRNGEEEIVFKRDGVVIEIFHFVSIRNMKIDVIMTHKGNRFNLNEKLVGKKQWFTSVDEALDEIRKYLKRV